MSSEHEEPGPATTTEHVDGPSPAVPSPAVPSTAVPSPAMPPLAVAAVARRLGVAPATLRTWDRRYGLGPSEHSAGEHRRYSALDVERLLVMRRLTLDGVAPGDAARAALAAELRDGATGSVAAGLVGALPVAAGLGAAGLGTAGLGDARRAGTGPDERGQAAEGVVPRPAGGLAAPAGGAVVAPTAVVDAALAGDGERCAALLRPGAAAGGDVAAWWTGLVEPALVDLARRTVVDPPGVDAEATLHTAALAALRSGAGRPPAVGADVVLLLVPAGEPRPLEAHALAAALTSHGVDARIVGGPVGPHHAVELVAMTRAVAVVTVGRREAPDLSVVARLAQERPDVPQLVRLPAAAATTVPVERSVHATRSFAGTLHEVLAIARPAVPHTASGAASSDELP